MISRRPTLSENKESSNTHDEDKKPVKDDASKFRKHPSRK